VLNLEVCAKCRKRAYGESQWTDVDGVVGYCCPATADMLVKTWPNPPRDCDHKLEHAVYATVNIDKKGGDDD
jgi:hypothetical protein